MGEDGLKLTRRGALIAAGAAATATAAPSLPAWATGGHVPARLDPARAATYRRLIRTLHGAPDGRFRHRPARAAARAFAGWYEEQDEPTRRHADAVLDALRARPPAGPSPPLMAAAVGLAAVACEPPPAEDERPSLPLLWPAA